MALIDKNTSPATKLDAILLHICNYQVPGIGNKNNSGGTIIETMNCYMNHDPKYFGLNSNREMAFYLDTLIKMGFIEPASTEGQSRKDYWDTEPVVFYEKIKITFKGLNHCYELENRGELSKKCFVAMVFDENKVERLNAIKEACAKHGFDAIDVEGYTSKENETIDSRIISALKSAKFCIADFTGLNQGAYFEGGYAMGRNMKVIFVCDKKDFQANKKHFDVNHYPFICYEDFTDLTNKLIDEIGAYIK